MSRFSPTEAMAAKAKRVLDAYDISTSQVKVGRRPYPRAVAVSGPARGAGPGRRVRHRRHPRLEHLPVHPAPRETPDVGNGPPAPVPKHIRESVEVIQESENGAQGAVSYASGHQVDPDLIDMDKGTVTVLPTAPSSDLPRSVLCRSPSAMTWRTGRPREG